MNSPALAVAIGLVLIYLLYSLLVTILSELIATRLGLRPRLLRLSIERMLNDGLTTESKSSRHVWRARMSLIVLMVLAAAGVLIAGISEGAMPGVWALSAIVSVSALYYYISGQSWSKILLKQPPDFDSTLAGAFYRYPSVKYLSEGDKKSSAFALTKPSYISADTFADTLVNMLADKGTGDTQMQKIKYTLTFNTYLVQPASLKNLMNLYNNANGDEVLFRSSLVAWYNATQERVNGWYKRKVQMVNFFIGLILVAAFNVNTISIAKFLLNDKDARDKAVEMGIAIANDSSKYETFVKGKADSVSGKMLDSSYKLVVDDINEANQILGLGWGFDTMTKEDAVLYTKTENLSLLKEYGEQLDKLDTLISNSEDEIQTLKYRNDTLEWQYRVAVNDTLINYYKDSLKSASPDSNSLNDSALKAEYREAKERYRLVGYNYAIVNVELNKYLKTLPNLISLRRQSEIIIDSLAQTHFVKVTGVSIGTEKEPAQVVIMGTRHYRWFERVAYVWNKIWTDFNFWGLFITAIMLTLGAPFWFDLLRKLVNIRMSGGTSGDAKTATANNPLPVAPLPPPDMNAVMPPPVPAPQVFYSDGVEAAAAQNRNDIMDIPGVTSIYTVQEQADNPDVITPAGYTNAATDGTIKVLGVNVSNEDTVTAVKQYLAKNVNVPYIIHVTGIAAIQAGNIGQIRNKNRDGAFGSIGCFLERGNGERYLISCWHVLTSNSMDYSYEPSETEREIVDHNNDKFGELSSYNAFTYGLDVGIAKCTVLNDATTNKLLASKLSLSQPLVLQCQKLAKNTPVKFFDTVGNSIVQGSVYTYYDSMKFQYGFGQTKTINNILVVSNYENNTHKPIGKKGNSGSVIFDDQGKAAGLLIGSDEKFTYLHRLDVLLNRYSVLSLM